LTTVLEARLVIVSDSHLSARAPEADRNWSAVTAHTRRARPDLVIHAGDLTLDGMTDPDDLRHGRAGLDQLPVPWLAVPGNHDIGDNASPLTPFAITVNAARRRRWLDLIGTDWWLRDIGGWDLIGLNAQLFGSGLPAEQEQWTWLRAHVAPERSGRPLVLITHKPIDAGADELAAAPHYRYVPAPARDRLTELLKQRQPRLVLSGHVHQYRRLDIRGTAHTWAPTTWAVLPDEIQATFGVKRCGVLSVDLDSRGSAVTLVEPRGLQQMTLGRHLPDSYSH
jgi:3',5'-cyclic AMP phosphodiesterase CpdA